MMMNRNKRGVAIDLKTDRGREVLRKLIATADAVTENFRPGTLERLGLSYEALSKDNPGPHLLRGLRLWTDRTLR